MIFNHNQRSGLMNSDISEREGEIWGPETYYFFCPVCDKPYSIRYDASGRKSFDGKYDTFTCFIKEEKCTFCETKLYVAYNADKLHIVAYDSKEEDRWLKCMASYEKKRQKLKKIKQQCKAEPTEALKKKRDTLKRKLDKLKQELIAKDEEYEEDCDRMMTARRHEESVTF